VEVVVGAGGTGAPSSCAGNKKIRNNRYRRYSRRRRRRRYIKRII
jgi:hypothetical protein